MNASNCLKRFTFIRTANIKENRWEHWVQLPKKEIKKMTNRWTWQRALHLFSFLFSMSKV